jgi:hypothetical protein
MTRQLKPQIVDEVKSPNGLVVLPVYFDRNEKDFYVEVTDRSDRVRADSVIEVKRLAKEMLAKAVAFAWEGVIILELQGSYEERHRPGSPSYGGLRFGASVQFEFRRMERSRHPTDPNKFVYRKHLIDFEAAEPDAWKRKRREKNEDLEHCYSSMDDVVLPYGEETWAGLHAMKRAVDNAQAQLEALVARKDLADRLRLVGKQAAIPILPAAVEK